MAEARLLYGCVIRDAMATGDKELVQAVAKVSKFMLSRATGDDAELKDWREADAELRKSMS